MVAKERTPSSFVINYFADRLQWCCRARGWGCGGVTAETGDYCAVPSRLLRAHLVDLPEMRRIINQAVGDRDGDVEVGKVVGRIGPFAVFQRNLEGGPLPDVFQRVEVAVLSPSRQRSRPLSS